MLQLSTHFLDVCSKFLGSVQEEQLLFMFPFSHVVHPASQGLQSLVILSMYLSLVHLLHETPSIHSKHEASQGLQVAEALSLYYPTLQLSTHFLDVGSKYLGSVQDKQLLFTFPFSHVVHPVLQGLHSFVVLSMYLSLVHLLHETPSVHSKHEELQGLHVAVALSLY